MNKKIRQQLAQRKRRIQRRLDKQNLAGMERPMFTASNIHYEMADRTRAVGADGIGAIHWLARRLGLIDATLLPVGKRLLKIRPDDREAGQLVATLQLPAKSGRVDPPMAAQRWMWPEDATALGSTIEWVGSFRRLTGGALESKAFLAHPGCFFVAARCPRPSYRMGRWRE